MDPAIAYQGARSALPACEALPFGTLLDCWCHATKKLWQCGLLLRRTRGVSDWHQLEVHYSETPLNSRGVTTSLAHAAMPTSTASNCIENSIERRFGNLEALHFTSLHHEVRQTGIAWKFYQYATREITKAWRALHFTFFAMLQHRPTMFPLYHEEAQGHMPAIASHVKNSAVTRQDPRGFDNESLDM